MREPSLRGGHPEGRERAKTSAWSARRSDAGGSRSFWLILTFLLFYGLPRRLGRACKLSLRAVFTWGSKSNCFFITTLHDWLKKRANFSSNQKPKPIVTYTQIRMRFCVLGVSYIYFEFWLVHLIVCILCDWSVITQFGFGVTSPKWKLLWSS